MTVKFRDPTSAKACIIVSHPFHHCTSTFVPGSHSELAENARQVLRPPSSRSVSLHRSTAIQTFERRRRHARRWCKFGTKAFGRFCSVIDKRRRSLSLLVSVSMLWFSCALLHEGRQRNLLTLAITIFSFGVSPRQIPILGWITNGPAPSRNFDLDVYLRPSFPSSGASKEGLVSLSPPPVTGLNKFYLRITNPFLNCHCGG